TLTIVVPNNKVKKPVATYHHRLIFPLLPVAEAVVETMDTPELLLVKKVSQLIHPTVRSDQCQWSLSMACVTLRSTRILCKKSAVFVTGVPASTSVIG